MSPSPAAATDTKSLTSALDPLVDGVGSHGLSIYALCRALDLMMPLASTKFPTLQSTIQKTKDGVDGWVSGGGSRALYAALYDVQTMHAFFRAAISPLVVLSEDEPEAKQDARAVQNAAIWGDAKRRAHILAALKQLLASIDDVKSTCLARRVDVTKFHEFVSTQTGAIQGILADAKPDKDQAEIARLQTEITASQAQLADYNQQLTSAIGKCAAASAGAGVSLIAGASIMAVSPAAGPAAPVAFVIGALVLIGGSAVGGAIAGTEGNMIQELQSSISETTDKLAKDHQRILDLDAEIAAMSVLSSQLAPLADHLAKATDALSTEISAWEYLQSMVSDTIDQAEKGATDASGSPLALIAIATAMQQFHVARDKAQVMLSMELLPVVVRQ